MGIGKRAVLLLLEKLCGTRKFYSAGGFDHECGIRLFQVNISCLKLDDWPLYMCG